MVLRPVSIGARIKRREDPRLIRGLGLYTDDLRLHGMLECAFVRSEYAAGRIVKIDSTRALQRRGVVAVYTYDDLRGEVARAPCAARMDETRDVEHPLLADGAVRYLGQPLALVVAQDRYLARDAALDVDVEIEPGPCVVDPLAALEPDTPRVYRSLPDNVNVRIPPEPEALAAVEKAFAEADGTLSLRIVNQRVAPVPLECRAVVADWQEGAQKLTVWISTQVPHQAKQQIAICLGLSELGVRVIAPEVGGGFGCKLPVYAEECLLSWVSRRLRLPVKWAETRTENLMNTTHGRGQLHDVEAAYRRNGELLALRGRIVAEVGAYASYLGGAIPTFTLLMYPGCYRVGACAFELVNVYTNTMATDAYRGAGRPEAAYAIEMVMDELARKLGIDPVELRRRNFIPPDAFPYQTAGGATYDTGEYEAALDKALDRFDYSGARAAQAEARSQGRLVGIGIATFTEICGLGPSSNANPLQRTGTWESAQVRVEPTGNVTIMTGASPHGQGQETAFAQLASDAFGVGIDDVRVVHGDTDVVPHGVGTFGSRGLVVGGTALHMALEKVKAKAAAIAAHLLDTTPDRLRFDGESFSVAGAATDDGAERRMTFREVASAAHLWNVPVPGQEPGLEAVARFEPEGTTFPFGAHLCQVEIDRETGQLEIQRYVAVDDCGNIVNPLLAEGQRLGGIVQGLGQALCEQVVYDETGQLTTATLMDYAVPKATMFPEIELDSTCTPTPLNPLGAKGIGELGTIGSARCLMSAVHDALAPLGVAPVEMPVTTERLWRVLREAGA